MVTVPIDRMRLINFMNAASGTVSYDLGEKPRLGSLPGKGFRTADCSGYARCLLYYASYGKIKLKTGSWYQQEWCKAQRLKQVRYSEVAGLKDNRLRIAFIDGADGKGHVWLVINGMTVECYGGHGAGRRPWNTPVLLNQADACFVLTDKLP